jgi:hypothetical protein
MKANVVADPLSQKNKVVVKGDFGRKLKGSIKISKDENNP